MYMGLVERGLFDNRPISNHDDDSPRLMGSAITLIVLTGLVVITRIYCRAYLVRSMGADDWTMIIAALAALGLVTANCIGVTHYGAGRHGWTLPKEWAAPARKTGYIGQIFYFISLGFCKTSLVLFIIRITSSRTTLRVSWGILIFCTCYNLAAVLTSVLWCVPPEYAWKMFTPEGKDMKGVCLDQRALQYALPAINILTDFVIWLLPLKMIWNVQLPPRQKASLIAIFAFGAMGVFAGILRLFSIKKFVETTDPSFDGLNISIWSIVEATVSIMCGSAPAIKPFFSKFLPGLLGVSTFKSYTKPTSGGYERSGNSMPKSKSHPVSYALGSLNPVTHRQESSSTEEFGFGPSTKIEGRMVSSTAGSEEYLNEPAGSVGHGGIGEGVKVTTDVQIHVEERV